LWRPRESVFLKSSVMVWFTSSLNFQLFLPPLHSYISFPIISWLWSYSCPESFLISSIRHLLVSTTPSVTASIALPLPLLQPNSQRKPPGLLADGATFFFPAFAWILASKFRWLPFRLPFFPFRRSRSGEWSFLCFPPKFLSPLLHQADVVLHPEFSRFSSLRNPYFIVLSAFVS